MMKLIIGEQINFLEIKNSSPMSVRDSWETQAIVSCFEVLKKSLPVLFTHGSTLERT